MKKHATVIVLFLAVLAVVGYLVLDRDRVTEGEKRRRDNNVFTAWRKDELSKIVVTHEGETIVLERDPKKDSGWRMTSPRDERADVAAVERLLTTLEFAAVNRKASEAALGFEAPRAMGEVRMGGLATRFVLGGPSPRPEGSSYLRIDDNPPIVVSKELTATLLASADTYRDRTVVPYLSLELSRFEVKVNGGGGFALARHDDHSFLVADRGVLASRAAVERVWTALAEMRAEAFPKDADADRLTASPRLTIVMTPKESAKPAAELVLGGACPGHPDDIVVLRKAPTRTAACAPKSVLEALLSSPESFVDKRLFPLKLDEIEEVTLQIPSAADKTAVVDGGWNGLRNLAKIEVARKGTGFRLRAPDDRDLDADEADAMSEVVGRIADNEAIAVTKGPAIVDAIAKVTVRFANGERELSVEIGALRPDGRALVRRSHDGAQLEVSAAVGRWLFPRETTYRPRYILDKRERERRPSRLLLRCGTPQELVDRGEGWKLLEPKGFDADGVVVQLVAMLTRGKIDGWVSDVDDGSFGIPGAAASGADGADGKSCRVVLGFEDGNAPTTLTFGAEGEGGTYARVDTRTGVFVAPPSYREMMKRIFVSRSALRVDESKIENVRATLDGRPVKGDLVTLAVGVSTLVADSVLSVGKAKPAEDRAVGPVDLVVNVARSEGGPPRRIACRPFVDKPGEHACAADDVDAVFVFPNTRLTAFLPAPAASADAGPAAGPDASVRTNEAGADAARTP